MTTTSSAFYITFQGSQMVSLLLKILLLVTRFMDIRYKNHDISRADSWMQAVQAGAQKWNHFSTLSLMTNLLCQKWHLHYGCGAHESSHAVTLTLADPMQTGRQMSHMTWCHVMRGVSCCPPHLPAMTGWAPQLEREKHIHVLGDTHHTYLYNCIM